MYSYYGLAALGPHMQKYLFWKKYITKIQLTQFLLVMTHSFQLLFRECDYPRIFMAYIGFYSILFMFMFSDFYIKAYKRKKMENNKKKLLKEKESKETTAESSDEDAPQSCPIKPTLDFLAKECESKLMIPPLEEAKKFLWSQKQQQDYDFVTLIVLSWDKQIIILSKKWMTASAEGFVVITDAVIFFLFRDSFERYSQTSSITFCSCLCSCQDCLCVSSKRAVFSFLKDLGQAVSGAFPFTNKEEGNQGPCSCFAALNSCLIVCLMLVLRQLSRACNQLSFMNLKETFCLFFVYLLLPLPMSQEVSHFPFFQGFLEWQSLSYQNWSNLSKVCINHVLEQPFYSSLDCSDFNDDLNVTLLRNVVVFKEGTYFVKRLCFNMTSYLVFQYFHSTLALLCRGKGGCNQA